MILKVATGVIVVQLVNYVRRAYSLLHLQIVGINRTFTIVIILMFL